MATYGSRDKNPFQVPTTYKINGVDTPSNNGNTKYYTLVDSTTGEITIKSPTVAGAISGAGADRTIGVIPKDGTFKPTPGSATVNEIKYFESAVGQKAVKNHGVITAQKAGAQNAQQLIFPNSAKPGANQGQNVPPGSSQTDVTTDSKNLESSTGKAKGRNGDYTYGNLTYPVDLSVSSQDKIKFTILRYASRGLTIGAVQSGGGGGSGLSPRADASGRILGTIFLPIPGGISDTNTAGWGDSQSMNAFELAAADIALASIQQRLSAGVDKLGNLAGNLGQNDNLKNEGGIGVAAAFAAAATQGTAGQLLSRTQGAVFNPNLELLFNGPELRSFTFTFKMSARSKPEADVVVKIIRAFKQAMSVQKSEAQLFLKAPNTFLIEYLHKNQVGHTRIGKIKECALQSMTTRYAPEGQYATYTDGTPVSYEIDLQFKELEPIFNDDYNSLRDTHIGY